MWDNSILLTIKDFNIQKCKLWLEINYLTWTKDLGKIWIVTHNILRLVNYFPHSSNTESGRESARAQERKSALVHSEKSSWLRELGWDQKTLKDLFSQLLSLWKTSRYLKIQEDSKINEQYITCVLLCVKYYLESSSKTAICWLLHICALKFF